MGFSFPLALICGWAIPIANPLCSRGNKICSKVLLCSVFAPFSSSCLQTARLGKAGIASACLFCWLALIAALTVPGVFIPPKWGHLPCLCVGCRSFLSLGSSLLQHYRRLESRGMWREGVFYLCRFCAELFACRN